MRHFHRLWLQQCVANWNYACNMSWRSKWRADTSTSSSSTSSSSSSSCGLKCVRPQTATILTRRKWKLLPFPFCGTLPWQCGAVAQGCGCGFGFRFGFWICYCCWLRGEQQLHKIYTVFLRSNRKAYWPRRQSIVWENMLLQLGKLGKGTSTTLRITAGGGWRKKCRPFVLASHESYRQFLLAQLPNHFAHIALEWLGKHLNLCMRIKRDSRQRGWGIVNAFEIAVEPRHQQKLLKWLTCSEVRSSCMQMGPCALGLRWRLHINIGTLDTWRANRRVESKELGVRSVQLRFGQKPLTRCLSARLSVCRFVRIDSLAHWRRKLYGNQIKTAQHFSAFGISYATWPFRALCE